MSDDVANCEARLTALKARRQKWVNRYAEIENTRGESAQRTHCRHNIGLVDADILDAEAKLKATRAKAARAEGLELREEEDMVTRGATEAELNELRQLAADCDTHSRALAMSVKKLHDKLSATRMVNGGRGPGGMMLQLNLRQAAEGYFNSTVLQARPWSAPRRKTFAELIDGWAPALGPSESPPPSPPPPAARDKGFQRPVVGASLTGGPTLT
jgi:hypothetical protein